VASRAAVDGTIEVQAASTRLVRMGVWKADMANLL
jgi:hypothetical protein